MTRTKSFVAVSIPFKREGSFGRIDTIKKVVGKTVSIPFKREGSFGQAKTADKTATVEEVSIPFKREGSFGRRARGAHDPCRDRPLVSIPFKREGSFGHRIHCNDRNIPIRFNSLQTGRLIRTHFGQRYLGMGRGFPFPSNGKAHSDRLNPKFEFYPLRSFNSLQTGRLIRTPSPEGVRQQPGRVSIPFKREGSFGPIGTPIISQKSSVSIPFKREGSFGLKKEEGLQPRFEFQFPSNGKAHSDSR